MGGRRRIPAAFLVAFTMLSFGCRAGESPREEMVSLGDYRLEVRIAGRGAPAVVLLSGLGDTLDRWGGLQERLARFTRVIAYNRAGYGKSGAGPFPRDVGREALELKLLLERAAVPVPCVLVGHSLGGHVAQLFAERYPGLACGLLLLDPPPSAFILGREYVELGGMAGAMIAEWEAAAARSEASSDPGEKARAVFLHAIASEQREMFGTSSRETAAIATFGNLPLVVVASGRPNPGFGAQAESFQKFWAGQSEVLSRKSARGRFVPAPGSSHNIPLDAPGLVEKEVLSLVAEARRAGQK